MAAPALDQSGEDRWSASRAPAVGVASIVSADVEAFFGRGRWPIVQGALRERWGAHVEATPGVDSRVGLNAPFATLVLSPAESMRIVGAFARQLIERALAVRQLAVAGGLGSASFDAREVFVDGLRVHGLSGLRVLDSGALAVRLKAVLPLELARLPEWAGLRVARACDAAGVVADSVLFPFCSHQTQLRDQYQPRATPAPDVATGDIGAVEAVAGSVIEDLSLADLFEHMDVADPDTGGLPVLRGVVLPSPSGAPPKLPGGPPATLREAYDVAVALGAVELREAVLRHARVGALRRRSGLLGGATFSMRAVHLEHLAARSLGQGSLLDRAAGVPLEGLSPVGRLDRVPVRFRRLSFEALRACAVPLVPVLLGGAVHHVVRPPAQSRVFERLQPGRSLV